MPLYNDIGVNEGSWHRLSWLKMHMQRKFLEVSSLGAELFRTFATKAPGDRMTGSQPKQQQWKSAVRER